MNAVADHQIVSDSKNNHSSVGGRVHSGGLVAEGCMDVTSKRL